MSEVGDQQSKNLEYLRDCLLNGTANIQGCLKHIEEQLRFMTEALSAYERGLNED